MPDVRRVAILAPMRPELRPVVRVLGLRRGGGDLPDLHRGTRGGLEVFAATTGIGMGPAARVAERLLDRGPFERVLVVGIAGGIGPGVTVGDLVVPELVVDLASGAEHRPSPLGEGVPRGVLATSDELVVDREAVARLERRGVVAVDMETAAIAAVCERRGCAWSVFRGISDRADDGSVDPAILALAGPDGDGDPAAVARFVLTRPWRIPRLVRLARGMRAAADVAARAAARALESL